jgi:apolipoprotein N-acyltransferase
MRSLFGNLHTPSSFSPLSGRIPGRTSAIAHAFWIPVCLLAGWLQAAALAWPLRDWSGFGLTMGQPSGWLQILSLALLVLALQQAPRVAVAAWRGWLFASAWLTSTFWWLFVSMHTYGGLSAWMAVLAVLALAGALALYYGLAAGLLAAWSPRSRMAQAPLFAALWTLAELMRGQWLTGFPWGAGGYAQVDLLAAWAPWIGVYGMGLLAALMAYALGSCITGTGRWIIRWLTGPARSPVGAPSRRRTQAAAATDGASVARSLASLAGLLVLFVALTQAGRWLPPGQRDTASAGTMRVWLLQGNIDQGQKFDMGTGVAQALDWYPREIALAAQVAKDTPDQAPQLVVAPETALPMLPDQLGAEFWRPLLEQLAQPGVAQPVNVLFGLPLGSYAAGYTNSAWGLDPGTAARAGHALREAGGGDRLTGAGLGDQVHPYQYDKHHLVPFGEFIPALFRWFVNLMNIPLGDFDRGALGQPSWPVAGQRVAPNICYEDLFGEELAAPFLVPERAPTVLVNLSNIAWFGDTIAIDQHLQISRLRTLELGRPMLRATNTGATALIDHRGVVAERLARLTRSRLEVSVEGRTGITPYAHWTSRWGLMPLWIGCLTVALLVASMRQRGGRRRRL